MRTISISFPSFELVGAYERVTVFFSEKEVIFFTCFRLNPIKSLTFTIYNSNTYKNLQVVFLLIFRHVALLDSCSSLSKSLLYSWP